MSECFVCFEAIIGKNKKILCKHCNFESCTSCTKKYILDSINEASCMSPLCKKIFDRDYLISVFSYTFINKEYKKHREDLLFDLEKAKFQETLAYIEPIRELENIGKQISELRIKKKNIEN